MELLGVTWLFGVLAFYFIPVRNRKHFYVFYSIIFALIGFSFQPHLGDDLIREYENLEDIRRLGWEYFSTETIKYSDISNKFEGLYTSQLYYYLFSKLPVFNFLPAITLFIEYLLQFDLAEKCIKKADLGRNSAWLLFTFVLCTRETYMMMSGIRNQLAFTIFCYFLYVELVEERHKVLCWVMYAFSCFMHQSAIVLLVCRIFLIVRNRKIKTIIAGLCLCWSYFLSGINWVLSKIPNSSFITSILYKINIYTVNNGGNANNIILRPIYARYMIAYLPILLLVIIIFIYQWKRNNALDKQYIPKYTLRNTKLYISRRRCLIDRTYLVSDFLTFVSCFALGSASYYWLYLRYAIPSGILGCVAISTLLERENQDRNKRQWYLIVLICCFIKFAIIMLYMNRNMDFDLFGLYGI